MTVAVIHPRFATVQESLLSQLRVSLTLVRTDETTGETETLDAQEVLMARGGGGMADLNLIDGYFLSLDSFDVETGDTFTLGDGQRGEIQTVWPTEHGWRRADFILDSGGRARLLASGL